MIDPKPLKRSPALISFSKDHHFALLLIWKIRQGLRLGIDLIRIRNYINFFFENSLKDHFKEEEELLFIHLNENNKLIKIAEEDHKDLAKLAEKINCAVDTTLLTTFADKLETHIRFEERDLFHELQSTLSDSELNIIADKIASSHQNKTADNWQDEFWIKPSGNN